MTRLAKPGMCIHTHTVFEVEFISKTSFAETSSQAFVDADEQEEQQQEDKAKVVDWRCLQATRHSDKLFQYLHRRCSEGQQKNKTKLMRNSKAKYSSWSSIGRPSDCVSPTFSVFTSQTRCRWLNAKILTGRFLFPQWGWDSDRNEQLGLQHPRVADDTTPDWFFFLLY